MVAAFAGAVALAGCAHMMGQRPQEAAKAPMVQSAQPASQQSAPAEHLAPPKAKPRQATPAKAPTPTPTPTPNRSR